MTRKPLRSSSKFVGMLVIGLMSSGCVGNYNPPPRSTLEIRAAQTRTFSARDEKLVMRAALNTFQDEGFVTKSGIIELGLIIAVKERDASNFADTAMRSILMGAEARWPNTEVIEANLSVSPFGRDIRVRMNCVRKILDNTGAIMGVEEVSDPLFYQDFFAKLDKSILIQRERI